MEVIDVFDVDKVTYEKIRELLENADKVPDAGNLFRYYNPRSKAALFEKMVCELTGTQYALVVNSGTSALIAALAAAGIGPGDEVIVPAYTFLQVSQV